MPPILYSSSNFNPYIKERDPDIKEKISNIVFNSQRFISHIDKKKPIIKKSEKNQEKKENK